MTYDELMAAQSAHYNEMMAQSVDRVNMLPIDEADRDALIAQIRAEMADDLARFGREAKAFFERGGRFNEALH